MIPLRDGLAGGPLHFGGTAHDIARAGLGRHPLPLAQDEHAADWFGCHACTSSSSRTSPSPSSRPFAYRDSLFLFGHAGVIHRAESQRGDTLTRGSSSPLSILRLDLPFLPLLRRRLQPSRSRSSFQSRSRSSSSSSPPPPPLALSQTDTHSLPSSAVQTSFLRAEAKGDTLTRRARRRPSLFRARLSVYASAPLSTEPVSVVTILYSRTPGCSRLVRLPLVHLALLA